MLEAIFSWTTVRWLMLLLYVPSCIGLIAIVLLQKGKGAGFAGAFGVGPGSEAVFGPRASKSLPVRMTYVMATIFVVLAFGLSVVDGKVARGRAPERVDADSVAAAIGEEQGGAPIGSGLLGEGLGAAYNDVRNTAPEPVADQPGADGGPAVPATPETPAEASAPTEEPIETATEAPETSQP